ncbi:MAG TPA: TlpA disulfide reductase family protein [Candidatus Polarisedimenticolia bacterium]
MRRLAAVVTLLSGLALCAAPASSGELAAGSRAPLFALSDLAGKQVLLSDYKGRVVLLHFWATWCAVCRQEMPILEEVSRAHADDVAVLAVNLGERPRKVRAYVEGSGLTFPVLMDSRGKVAEEYGVLSLPVTLIVGRDGRVADRILMGDLNRLDLAERLRHLAGP